MQAHKFHPNNFVIVKVGEEWFEARVIDVITEHKVTETYTYRIYVFRLLCELEHPVKEYQLLNANSENFKKFKITSFRRSSQPHIPKALIDLLFFDKKNINLLKLPSKQPISKILNDFKKHISSNKPNVVEEELEEIVIGFCHLFDQLFNKYICYSNEEYQILNDIKNTPKITIYGPEHLLRLIFLIQKRFVNCIDSHEVAGLVFDYTVYLADFLYLNQQKYFLKENYLSKADD